MEHYDYLIVGAGLFGAVFAREAVDAGKRCLVIDQREQPGGNVRCEEVEGITVHKYGAHIFHTDREDVWFYVNRYARFLTYVHRVTAVNGGKKFSMPFNMHTFQQMWGVTTAEEARTKIAAQSSDVAEVTNLEEQAVSLVGRDIYETLVKGYTEKQWGRSCKELPASIIRRLPLRFVYDDRYFTDPYQGIPEGGYNPLIGKLLEGIPTVLGTSYQEFIKDHPQIADRTVYTGAIDEFFGYCLGRLEYRSLRFEEEVLDQPDFQGEAVVNYCDGATPFTRIIEHKYFDGAESPKTVITREYPEEWQPGCPAYYPINDSKNQALYNRYLALAEERPDVVFGGRLGAYKYYDMDDAIAAALELADKELGRKE